MSYWVALAISRISLYVFQIFIEFFSIPIKYLKITDKEKEQLRETMPVIVILVIFMIIWFFGTLKKGGM